MLLPDATGMEGDKELPETGLELGDSTKGFFFSGSAGMAVFTVDEEIDNFWICECKLAAALTPVLRLLLTLPVRDGGLERGCESNIWTVRSRAARR